MRAVLLNAPLLGQRNHADCLPSCVEMVLRYFGRAVDPAWLRNVLEYGPIGTPGFKLLNLQQHGYFVQYAPATDERVLRQALASGTPPIALVLTANLSYWKLVTAHAVVVVGIDESEITLNDPAFPKQAQRVAIDEFMLAWSDFDYLYALVRPQR